MDDDVKLSMEQAHEKWVTRWLVIGALVLCATVASTCAYQDRNRAQVEKAAYEHGCTVPAR